MPVCPDWLDGVTADAGNLRQQKGFRCQRLVWIFIQVAKDIHLTLATGAGAGIPKLFQSDKVLSAIGPFHGQFGSDILYVQRSHDTGYFLGGRSSIHSDYIDSPITAGNLIFVEY